MEKYFELIDQMTAHLALFNIAVKMKRKDLESIECKKLLDVITDLSLMRIADKILELEDKTTL